MTLADAYYYCQIPPNQFDMYTPREIGFMVDIARTRMENKEFSDNARIARLTAYLFALFGAPDEWRNPLKFMPVKPSEPVEQTDKEMEDTVKNFVHPILSSLSEVLNG